MHTVGDDAGVVSSSADTLAEKAAEPPAPGRCVGLTRLGLSARGYTCAMSLAVIRHVGLWQHQPRLCDSRDGRRMTWLSFISGTGVRSHMYRLGNQPLTDGEAMPGAWGGTSQ